MTGTKLDGGASIPLTWFFLTLVAVLGPVCGGSLWVFRVNARLERIEQKLGITGDITRAPVVEVVPEAQGALRRDSCQEHQ